MSPLPPTLGASESINIYMHIIHYCCQATLLSKLRHPNIVSYRESFQDQVGFLYIVMNFCEGGDLYTKLKEQKGQILEETQIVEWFVQIAMALQVRFTLSETEASLHPQRYKG